MYDHNVFAVLSPFDRKNKAISAFQLPENARWFRKAIGGVAEEPTINSREATHADNPETKDEELGTVDRLVLGTKPSSHILLGHRGTKGVSAKQYNITLNNDLHIWLHDYRSTHGTAVSYSRQNQREVRKKETWILAYEPGRRNRFGDISIHSGGLAIKIEFPNQAVIDSRYVENLRALVNKFKEEVPALVELALDSEANTHAPNEAQTLGRGLSTTTRKASAKARSVKSIGIIRVRDGKYLAAKSFVPPANKRKPDEVDPAWLTVIRREFTIMKDNPHPNVMQVFELRETPAPEIIMAITPMETWWTLASWTTRGTSVL